MHFADYLNSSKKEIEKEIAGIFTSWQKEVKNVSLKLLPLVKIFIDSMVGGKRLRGTSVKLGYALTTSKYSPEINKAAAAYEIFQTSILLHDDIIDKSILRRGKETVYKKLGGNHYGISQAICLGDLGFFLAIKIISSLNFPKINKEKAILSFIKVMHNTILGEMFDVEGASYKKLITEDEVLEIYRRKTADYSFTGPLQMGAILAGARELILSKIKIFGENLGIAYQIQDDIFGVFGDEETIGKSVLSDIIEGKITLLYIQARKKASSRQISLLSKLYGRDKISKNDADKIKRVFVETGALTYAKSQVFKYVKKAEEVIPKLGASQDVQIIFEELADYLVNRIK